jgi:hypothetical protein
MRKQSNLVTYLVSGDSDIHPSDENIRRSGRRVRHGKGVDGDARIVLRSGRRYVVVAHGNRKGTTVSWFREDWSTAQRWLYVGMKRPPRGVRLYLYSCHAGKKLPRFLKKNEVFGHTDEVPTPTGVSKDIVLAYFSEVEALFKLSDFDREHWRTTLGEYVNRLLLAETQQRTTISAAAVLQILRKSLGYP